MTDAYQDFLCRISTVNDIETNLWYCDNCVKKFTFEELACDIDNCAICPICNEYVEPIEDD